MNAIDLHEFLKIHQRSEDALSTTIKINHGQVLNIVVIDLIEKYKSNVDCGDQEWATVFEKVLSYYLDEEEMSRLTTAIHNGQLPADPLELFKQGKYS